MGSQNKLELEQPLIPPESNLGYSLQNNDGNNNNDTAIVGGGPRILDRDGTFAQSRGRWSVTNTTTKTTSSRSQPRQRRGGPVTTSSIATDTTGATNDGGVPYGVTPTPPSIHTSEDSLKQSMCCCTSSDHLPLTPRRCWDDWFHTLSYMPTCILMLGVFAAYFITIVIFAGLYLTVNKVGVYYDHSDTTHGGETTELMTEDLALGSGTSGVDEPSFCGMDINNHMEALYFSLSTMATIGYGTSDYYFGECWTPFILVLLQVFSAIVFSSLAIGLLFQRMSRGQKRGRTIVFSDVAVIRKVRGRWYFMFRLAELRKRHIIGAKVRMFCVRHERCPIAMANGGDQDPETGNAIVELETAYFVSHPLPLVNGSQSTNTTNNNHSGLTSANASDVSESSYEQSILMGLPHVLVHSMDGLSPMIPPRPVWYDERGVPHGPQSVDPSTTLSEARADGTVRESQTGNDDDKPSSLLMEERQSTPYSLLQQMTAGGNNTNTNQPSQEEITHFLQDRQAEIICFLEGTCENTGMALQARHSYRMEDIAFHQTFAPCVFPASVTATSYPMGGKRTWRHPFARNKAKVEQEPTISQSGNKGNTALEIDFTQFHDLLPAPYDSMSCPYIPSSSLRR